MPLRHLTREPPRTEAELRGSWERLGDGGTVSVPLEKQTWGDAFGLCTDRFGTSRLVTSTPED